jgi:hypothetical protein
VELADFATVELLAVTSSAVSLVQLDKNRIESKASVNNVFLNFITDIFNL